MDYKKIFKSKSLRMKILKALEWVPDSVMVPLQYRIHTHITMDRQNPKRYTEKIQWYKLHYRTEVMTTCVDKHAVKDYVYQQLGDKDILIPELGCWDNAEDIDFSVLPNNIVLKTTNGSGTNIFIDDIEEIDKDKVRTQLNQWLSRTIKSPGREWAYDNVRPRIICEPQIPAIDQHGNGLDDFKFFCFNGKIAMKWIDYDRFVDHKRVLYTPNGDRLPVECTYKSPENLEYPEEAFRILEPIALKLAEPFPHARIDLYYTEHKPYFGEITFYSGSGYELFSPDGYDYELGKDFILPLAKSEG